MDQVWLHILHGKSMNGSNTRPRRITKTNGNKSLHELEKMFENMANQYKDFLSTIQDGMLYLLSRIHM